MKLLLKNLEGEAENPKEEDEKRILVPFEWDKLKLREDNAEAVYYNDILFIYPRDLHKQYPTTIAAFVENIERMGRNKDFVRRKVAKCYDWLEDSLKRIVKKVVEGKDIPTLNELKRMKFLNPNEKNEVIEIYESDEKKREHWCRTIENYGDLAEWMFGKMSITFVGLSRIRYL